MSDNLRQTGKDFLLVIRCQKALDIQGKSLYRREVCGVPLLDLLARRLNATGLVKNTLLVMESQDPAAADAAKRHGWFYVVRGKYSDGHLKALWAFLNAKYLILTDVKYPLVDPAVWRQMASQFLDEGLPYLRVKQWQGFAPIAMVRRSAVVFSAIKTLVRRGDSTWKDIEKNLFLGIPREFAIKTPEFSPCLAADILDSEMLSSLGGIRTDLKTLLKKEADDKSLGRRIFEKAQKRLYEGLTRSDYPQQANVRLNRFESENQLSEVKSFPLDVSISITGKCNANCLFCNYVSGSEENKNYFYLDHIKKMAWLKYTKKIGLGGGVGEPLLHPQFLPIFNYITHANPHSKIRVITNGILLDDKICEAFAGNLHRLRVSLNAATKETWETLMRTQGFDNVCEGVSTLVRLKGEKKTKYPEILLMMVVCRENLQEVVKFVELAHALGVQGVSFSHFSKHLMDNCEMGVGSSLYFTKEKADQWLGRAFQRAKELDLELGNRPLPFSTEETGCFQGERVIHVPEKCYSPWKTCYLGGYRTAENMPLMGFCCSGSESRIEYNVESLDTENFSDLWNHSYLQYFRKTVNGANACKTNPICHFCKTVDQFDPENRVTYMTTGKKKEKSLNQSWELV